MNHLIDILSKIRDKKNRGNANATSDNLGPAQETLRPPLLVTLLHTDIYIILANGQSS